ncbi:MAG: hypothetical protein KF789_01250 [Bdellovibrionaceae bacterium]|nr:hypothetical protein [Pseudobdellovibrionaceae bacterium]
MGAWLVFIRERLPIPAYGLLAGGLALSGWALSNEAFDWKVLLGFVLIALFFAELRMMDELKDFKKDQIANPTRPLPRGVLKPIQVERAIRLLAIIMAIAALILFSFSPTAGLLYGVVTIYLWLMFREFYIGSWLEQRMFLYGLSHQVILIPLSLFSFSLHSTADIISADLYNSAGFDWALMVLGSFFGYEVCRKLDPKAHPMLRTYLHVYGAPKSGLIIIATAFVALAGAMMLADSLFFGQVGFCALFLPLLTPLAFFLTYVVLRRPEKYKMVEGLATLSLILHIWFPLLARMVP